MVTRIACLAVPEFAVAALCRADPDLLGVPFVLTDGAGSRANIVAASAPARALGIQPGRHTLAQARAIASQIVARPRDAAIEASATQALYDVAASLTARIEAQANGSVFLDATGATHLVPTERGFTTALVSRAQQIGLTVRAGIGATMGVARLAALYGDGTEVVPAGMERGFLAPLPVACLDPAPACLAALERWGIHRLGELARLPIDEVGTRLGAAGVALVRAARGEDDRPLLPHAQDGDVEEALTLEFGIDSLEPLLFVLRGLLERATVRLGLSGIGATRCTCTLGLDDRSCDVRRLPLLAPTRDVKTILALLRAELEAHPARAAITSVVVALTPAALRPTQLGLFAPAGPAPERLATTLAKLAALCGAERVGSPVVVDSHCPGRAALVPFAPTAAGVCGAVSGAALHRLALRAFRPPQPVDVFAERGVPIYLRGDALGGRVVEVAGPWRHSGEWWTVTPFSRDYYDLELSDGGVYRCFLDRLSRRWFVDGVYD